MKTDFGHRYVCERIGYGGVPHTGGTLPMTGGGLFGWIYGAAISASSLTIFVPGVALGSSRLPRRLARWLRPAARSWHPGRFSGQHIIIWL